MTQEDYIEMKKGYFKLVTDILTQSGSVETSITVMGKHIEDSLNAMVHVPIPSKFISSEEGKDTFMEKVLPNIVKKVQSKFTVDAVAWASEAWMRVAQKNQFSEEELSNWKDLPIQKEVLIVTIESEEQSDSMIKEIVRKGKQVNETGELTDVIELVDIAGLDMNEAVVAEGRFTGLYKKFTTLDV